MKNMLALYGHPFSSYTWKAQIALHALRLDYDFRILATENPESCPNWAFVHAQAGPLGQFPVLAHDDAVIFEATCIVEYLTLHFPSDVPLLPDDPDAAIAVRMLDRVFDLSVMNVMQAAVSEAIRHPGAPDPAILTDVRAKLHRTYAWLESWLDHSYHAPAHITLIECAAAPSLFYADWVEQIADEYPRLKAWRAQLNALPAVSRCIEAARPFRAFFPLGAPDRD